MSWSDKYVGLPEAECHCWELARRIYRGELGIELPAYEGSLISDEERAEVNALIGGEATQPRWQRVELSDLRPFDVMVFRRGRLRAHIGVAIDARHMIHMEESAHVTRFMSPKWKMLLAGVYRHVEAPVERAVQGGVQ